MRYQHNEQNYQRNLTTDDWTLEDIQEHEDVSKYDDIENTEEKSETVKPSVRKRIEEYLEAKRAREEDSDPFDDDYYYDDEAW